MAIGVLTGINILGVHTGKHTQNALTVLKVSGLGVLLVAGILFGKGFEGFAERPLGSPELLVSRTIGIAAAPVGQGPLLAVTQLTPDMNSEFFPMDFWTGLSALTMAVIAILWTYSGWHEAAYVVGEIQDQRHTIPRALLLGVSFVILLYVAVNLACILGVGFGSAQRSSVLVASVLSRAFGEEAGKVMSLLIMLSALGALNGTIITSSRIYAAVGADHPLFAPLGRWHPQLGTPVVALAVQGILSVLFVLSVGIFFQGLSGFDVLFACTAAVFWIFFLLTGIAFFSLRVMDRQVARPFQVPFYPITPLLFCFCCVGMLVASILANWKLSLIGLGLVALAIPFYLLSQALRTETGVASSEPAVKA
jgi:amino acid transporter